MISDGTLHVLATASCSARHAEIACVSRGAQCRHIYPGSQLTAALLYSAEPQVMRKDAMPVMKWGPPDEDGLVQFLVQEKGFNEDRVRKVVERIRSSRGKSNQGAARLCRLRVTLPGQWT